MKGGSGPVKTRIVIYDLDNKLPPNDDAAEIKFYQCVIQDETQFKAFMGRGAIQTVILDSIMGYYEKFIFGHFETIRKLVFIDCALSIHLLDKGIREEFLAFIRTHQHLTALEISKECNRNQIIDKINDAVCGNPNIRLLALQHCDLHDLESISPNLDTLMLGFNFEFSGENFYPQVATSNLVTLEVQFPGSGTHPVASRIADMIKHTTLKDLTLRNFSGYATARDVQTIQEALTFNSTLRHLRSHAGEELNHCVPLCNKTIMTPRNKNNCLNFVRSFCTVLSTACPEEDARPIIYGFFDFLLKEFFMTDP